MISQNLYSTVDGLLGRKEDHKLKSLLSRQTVPVIADIIERLSHGKRKTFALLPPETQAEVALLLSDHSRGFIFPRLSDHAVARFLHFNFEDDAADLLHEFEEKRRGTILGFLQDEKRHKVEKLLKFGPETAGGLMDLNFLLVKPETNIKEVSDKIREYLQTSKQAPLVVVSHSKGNILGFVPYRTVIVQQPTKEVGSVVQTLPLVSYKTDQERVLKMAMRERADVFGVIDDEDEFLGIIHLRDLLKVAQAEATEDVYMFAGVNTEEELSDPSSVAIKLRSRWLVINLATAFLAAFVVSQFESTIAKTAILAAYMPIVAGMGGNAGTQALAVVVRGLALGENVRRNRWRIIIKEMTAGFVNGLINGIIVAIVVYLFTGRGDIGLILMLSMIINLIIAGLFGAIVPIVLKAFKVDPAVASSVFVTTATDVFGFMTFLGLAAVML